YAGFPAHADPHIGRLRDYREESGQRDNTMVIVVSDNGASGEGGPDGSVNEMLFANGIPDNIQANLAMIDELGGTKTYNHYPNGWAMAFNTPFKMWKRYEFNGGTADPCIISWPSATADHGEIRHQYHHAIDIVPTILHTLAAEHPEKVRELINLWFAEAGANDALPLDDRSPLEIFTTPRPQLAAPRDRYTYFPDTAEVPESQAVNVRNRSFTIGALVDIPAPGAEGVLFAHGSRFGGHALYVKNNRLHYAYNWVGHFEQKIVGSKDLSVGKNLILAANFVKDGEDPPGVSTGILSLYHGETKAGEERIKTQPAHPHQFTGATINRVAVDVSGEPYIDLE